MNRKFQCSPSVKRARIPALLEQSEPLAVITVGCPLWTIAFRSHIQFVRHSVNCSRQSRNLSNPIPNQRQRVAIANDWRIHIVFVGWRAEPSKPLGTRVIPSRRQ